MHVPDTGAIAIAVILRVNHPPPDRYQTKQAMHATRESIALWLLRMHIEREAQTNFWNTGDDEL